MRDITRLKPALLGAAAMVLLATPGAAQAPAALSGLQTGIWELRDLGRSGRTPQHICVRNPERLLQVRHSGRACPRRILSQDSDSVTARYDCSGAGWGQTTVSAETPRLARIDTQGIHDGSPFHHVYEARRTGACS
ncbi:MAG: DUF3617 domain-containing protein [Parasphingopyxis sp.]|uniref:DUF3617 domain-containing protein n=1 Tax=Parasphingopyxis sp. TaxID=1920299 RepID=UPI003FA09523